MGLRVRTGLDRLADEGPAIVALRPGARVGLVAHPASIDHRLRHAADLLGGPAGLRLVRLFAPEHGLRGEAQDMEAVEDARDPTTGLEVRSLYGAEKTSLAPRHQDVDGLDAVVVDLQDVGARFYTFVYTLAFVMESCGSAGVPVVVLDRPNPIGGRLVEGPVLDPSFASFVGRFPLPVRHGMTVLELANLFREAFGVACEVRGVPMIGWRRRQWFDDTALPWVPPSPNMPTLETATVYPGGCLVEGTNLSEGRGTTRPFELVGAPWIDGPALRDRLADRALPGVGFRETSFRPKFHKHAEATCGGVQLHVLDREALRPFRTFLAVLADARALDPGRFAWRTETYEFVDDRPAIDLLLGRAGLREALEDEADLADLEAGWTDDLGRFDAERRRFLLYPD